MVLMGGAALAPAAGAAAPPATAATIADLSDPAMTTGTLSGVACPSATACLAVGSGPSQGADAVASVTGSSATWGALTPSSGDTGNFYAWNAIACPSATACLAVGADNLNAVVTIATLSAGTWSWTPTTELPNDATGAGSLDAIACPSTTTCLAVGSDGEGVGIATVATATASGWTWSPETTLLADASGQGGLNAIACPSATTCVAVGSDGSLGVAASATGTGATWTWGSESAVELGAASPGLGGLNGVACPSATTCVAVGWDNTDAVVTSGTRAASGWTWLPEQIVTPDASGGGELSAVACPSSAVCVAVGSTIANGDVVSTSTNGVYTAEVATATLSTAGVTWSPVSDVAPDPTGSDALAGISCLSAATCVAVGAGGAYGQELFGATTMISAPVLAPPTPAGLRAGRVGPVLLAHWSPVAGATSYRCALTGASGAPSGRSEVVGAPACRFAGLGIDQVAGVAVEALTSGEASSAAVAVVHGHRHTLRCARGKLTRRVTGLFPSCPPGWRP